MPPTDRRLYDDIGSERRSVVKLITERPPIEYIVDDLFWTRTIHLIIGPSGGGKTTWVSQYLIKDWREGTPVLGFKSHPKPFCYIVLDRDYYDVSLTWKSVGLKEDFPYFIRREQPDWDDIPNLAYTMVRDVLKLCPETKVLFLDGFTALTPNGKINDYGVVATFLLRLGRLCAQYDLTVVGMGHTAKLKKDQEIVHDRECALGSVAFGGFTGSMIKISHDPKDPDRSRILSVQPRHIGAQEFHYHFDKGMLLLDEDPTQPPESDESKAIMREALNTFPEGEEFEIKRLMEIATALDMPRRSQERLFQSWAGSEGLIERVRKGVYRRPRPS